MDGAISFRVSRCVPEGQVIVHQDEITGASGGREALIGIPSEPALTAIMTVREGLADVLTWLGEPIWTFQLAVAEAHYRGSWP